MNYYPHHIGDFNSATRHLTRVERSLYRDLIELYYDTEQPLPADDFERLARRVIASTDEEKEALKFVLTEFFDLDGDVYRHSRCDWEIEKYHANNAAKARAGKASAEARKRKSKGKKEQKVTDDEQTLNTNEHVLNGCATNQEPRTKNHTPCSPPRGDDAEPDGFTAFWFAYPRKTGKGNARKVWKKLKPSKALQQKILTALEQQKKSQQWTKDNGKFIPLPATWLNQERWDDEPDGVDQSQQSKAWEGAL